MLPVLGAFAGSLTTNAVDGESLDFQDAAQGALFNIIIQNLPTKYLGHKLNKSKSIYTCISSSLICRQQCCVHSFRSLIVCTNAGILPGPFYHVNDIISYLGRQSEDGSDQAGGLFL